jgi:hypothetical protein
VAYLERQQGTNGGFRSRIFEQERTAATLPRQFPPQKKYGAENIGPVGLGGDWRMDGDWDWDWDWDWAWDLDLGLGLAGVGVDGRGTPKSQRGKADKTRRARSK